MGFKTIKFPAHSYLCGNNTTKAILLVCMLDIYAYLYCIHTRTHIYNIYIYIYTITITITMRRNPPKLRGTELQHATLSNESFLCVSNAIVPAHLDMPSEGPRAAGKT